MMRTVHSQRQGLRYVLLHATRPRTGRNRRETPFSAGSCLGDRHVSVRLVLVGACAVGPGNLVGR